MTTKCTSCSEDIPDVCSECSERAAESEIYAGFFKHIKSVEDGESKCTFHSMCLYSKDRLIQQMQETPLLSQFLNNAPAGPGKTIHFARFGKPTEKP